MPAIGQQKQIQYLSGTGSDHTVAWDFFCSGGRKSGYWTKIQVPSCWELQGFGSYNYGRDYKTYGSNFRFADEHGLYKHRFNVPVSWKGKEVFIVFEGSMTDTDVKINGQVAGKTHQGAFYRFKYNITDKLKYGGSNLLEAEVSKMSSDRSVNNAERLADYWVFGGIFRPVYLEAVNKEHIDYVAIDAKGDGQFSMQVIPKNITTTQSVIAEITDLKGKKIVSEKVLVKKGDSVLTVKMQASNILKWTSETPHLYQVKVYLKNKDRIQYQMQERFGLRTIEVKHGDGIYLNGVQIKMKGVNRHCWWPETGRTLNDSLQMVDVLLIKEMNMNAVRCSHYPPDKRFLELCDSLGIYVLNELAGWQKAYSTQAGKPLVKALVLRDLNHPSIIFWDNGNEGGTNKELDAEFTKWDFSKRPVIHPHHRPGNAFSGIDCNHYEDYYSSQKILSDTLIYMPTEFLHAQDDGGGGATMYDFWNLHWKSKRSGGGFIWAFVDEGVVRTDMNNIIDANGLNANDGILGPHREKEGSFNALREIFSPVHIDMTKVPKDFSGEIEMENRYHFTNLNECAFRWDLVNFRSPYDDQFSGYTIEKSGKGLSPSIEPLAKGLLDLGLPKTFRQFDGLVLTATDKFGKEIYQWTWKLKTNTDLLVRTFDVPKGKTNIVESDTLLTLTCNGIEVSINKNTGMLHGVKSTQIGMGNLSISNGPVLVQGNARLREMKVDKNSKEPSVEILFDGNLNYVKWTMQENGWLALDYEYNLKGSFPFAGISFSYPENYILAAKWLGKGPYRQWKNRVNGAPVNVWQNFYNNTQTGYWPMVYPEFKGYYGDITWMEFNTVQGKFYMATRDEDLSVRLFNFYGLSGPKNLPELPVGDISFLDAIAPVGGKLAMNIYNNTRILGPQSEYTTFDGSIKHTIYFYFGLPKTTDSKEQYSRPKVDNVF